MVISLNFLKPLHNSRHTRSKHKWQHHSSAWLSLSSLPKQLAKTHPFVVCHSRLVSPQLVPHGGRLGLEGHQVRGVGLLQGLRATVVHHHNVMEADVPLDLKGELLRPSSWLHGENRKLHQFLYFHWFKILSTQYSAQYFPILSSLKISQPYSQRWMEWPPIGTHFVLCADYDVIEEEEMPQFSVTFNQLHDEGVADKVSLRSVLRLEKRNKVNRTTKHDNTNNSITVMNPCITHMTWSIRGH